MICPNIYLYLKNLFSDQTYTRTAIPDVKFTHSHLCSIDFELQFDQHSQVSDIFTLMFITMLYILASLALVSIVLPNTYFRLLLWADSSSQDVMASIYDEYDDYDLDYNLLY